MGALIYLVCLDTGNHRNGTFHMLYVCLSQWFFFNFRFFITCICPSHVIEIRHVTSVFIPSCFLCKMFRCECFLNSFLKRGIL